MLPLSNGAPICIDVLGYFKWRGIPANGRPGEGDFFCAQGLAVGFGRVSPVRAAFADAGFTDDEGWAVRAALGNRNGIADSVRIVTIHIRNNLPPVSFESLRCVVDKPRRHFAIDRNAVVVVKRDQFIELPSAGQCTGFVADAFHQTTVAHKYKGVVVDDGVTIAVELRGQKFFRQRHTYRVGQTLT